MDIESENRLGTVRFSFQPSEGSDHYYKAWLKLVSHIFLHFPRIEYKNIFCSENSIMHYLTRFVTQSTLLITYYFPFSLYIIYMYYTGFLTSPGQISLSESQRTACCRTDLVVGGDPEQQVGQRKVPDTKADRLFHTDPIIITSG